MVVVRGNSGITSSEMVQFLLGAVFGWIMSTADDFDVYAKFDRLEKLRENLRNITECMGYRSLTHPAALFWQSITAAEIYIDRHGIPTEVPLICDHPYLRHHDAAVKI